MERVLHHFYSGKNYVQEREHRTSASVNKIPTDEVATDERISMEEVCSNTWRLKNG